MAVDGQAVGVMAIADAIRETGRDAIRRLREMGIEVAMLTGDNRATAERIAGEPGIETVLAEVLPAQKADQVKEVQAQGRRMAMVGDGINYWAAGYNVGAFPLAAGVFYPSFGLLLRRARLPSPAPLQATGT